MRAIFRGILDMDPVTGVVILADFNPVFHLALAEGTTHASFTKAICLVDFEKMEIYQSFQQY